MSKRVVAPVPSARRLQIQIGVCKRLVKEVAYYEAEVLTNEARVQKMRDDGKDSYGEFKSISLPQLTKYEFSPNMLRGRLQHFRY